MIVPPFTSISGRKQIFKNLKKRHLKDILHTFYIVCHETLRACALPLLNSHKAEQSSFKTDKYLS